MLDENSKGHKSVNLSFRNNISKDILNFKTCLSAGSFPPKQARQGKYFFHFYQLHVNRMKVISFFKIL